MKKTILKTWMAAIIFSAAVAITSCKTKVKETNTPVVNNDSANAVNNAPVTIAPDAALTQSVSDATKDYPGVTATVVNGEIVLSGTIERSKWMKLNPTLQSLNPKRVKTDQLVIK